MIVPSKGNKGLGMEICPVGIKLMPADSMLKILKAPNMLALLIPPDVAAGSLLQTVAGHPHNDFVSFGAEKLLVSPMELKFGVWIVI
jgi:hypothetical protein